MFQGSWEPQKVHLLARAIWIVLAWPGFTFELPLRRCWISFDLLGFLRQNRDFSMGYGRCGARNIFRSLSLSSRATYWMCLILPPAGHFERRQCVGSRCS